MAADALFALLLAGLLIARFGCWLTYSPPASTADIRLFSRQLSRTVYLLLYLIIGAKQIVNIILRDTQALGILKPTSQVFVVYGLIALVLIRVVAYVIWRQYRFSFEPCSHPRDPAQPPTRTVIPREPQPFVGGGTINSRQ
jgi:cytochrome b561